MVTCASTEPVAVPRPPPLCGLRPPEPFRLLAEAPTSTTTGGDDSGSVSSVYKQKIDQMFDAAEGVAAAAAGVATASTTSSTTASSTPNSIQARIERMFSEVAAVEGAARHFSVEYLGAVTVAGKVTDLAGLQTPLRDLYFAYERKRAQTGDATTSSGRLEISAVGLRFQHAGAQPPLDQLTTFPSIAVWSAVQLVLQPAGGAGDGGDATQCAFLPLVTDPNTFDKQQLFAALPAAERRWLRTPAPLLAVVIRRARALDCHAFATRTADDAVVMAATLYTSLMAYMATQRRAPPATRSTHGVTCCPSLAATSTSSATRPVRPPRKNRSSTTSSPARPGAPGGPGGSPPPPAPALPPQPEPAEDDVHDDAAPVPVVRLQMGDKWSTLISRQQRRITAEIKQVMSRRAEEAENAGDILTKVTIPRSGSFLNAGGLTRYKSTVHRLNGQAMGGSPLGFHELFNEFRLQEGLHSMDDILGVIIDPEGMSFNDLKPIYKEFLLKLSVTLTKDELYQRSKAIMRRQRKKQLLVRGRRRRRASLATAPTKPLGGRFRRLQHVFQRIRTGAAGGRAKTSSTSAAPPAGAVSACSSSYDARHFTPRADKCASTSTSTSSTCSAAEDDIVDDDDDERESFFSVRQLAAAAAARNHNRHSSSGYVSCSECSFDSDTCTCVSADKCYCSLRQPPTGALGGGRRATWCCHPLKTTPTTMTPAALASWCGCDTDSCADSNKCYCPLQPAAAPGRTTRPSAADGGGVFAQLRQRGFVPPPKDKVRLIAPPGGRRRSAMAASLENSLGYLP